MPHLVGRRAHQVDGRRRGCVARPRPNVSKNLIVGFKDCISIFRAQRRGRLEVIARDAASAGNGARMTVQYESGDEGVPQKVDLHFEDEVGTVGKSLFQILMGFGPGTTILMKQLSIFA
jgi:hypothetical protein